MARTTVIPTQAGIHKQAVWQFCAQSDASLDTTVILDSRLRGNDELGNDYATL
jgi:hypothetical protein